MQIREMHNPWRDKLAGRTAMFRDAMFLVDVDARTGGRRVALHEYPKRNTPYAEDMGRATNKFVVQGYLIGPAYLDLKDNLVLALEKDGPGWLRLPLPFQMSDQQVMVMSYTVTEARERGGFCTVDMEFVEYGDPTYRQVISTTDEINKSSTDLENNTIGPKLNTIGPQLPTDPGALVEWGLGPLPDPAAIDAAAPYAQVYQGAGIGNGVEVAPASERPSGVGHN
jgi:hypothetical protein